MKGRRELMLEEMGLAPVWRLRGTTADVPSPEAAEKELPAAPAGEPRAKGRESPAGLSPGPRTRTEAPRSSPGVASGSRPAPAGERRSAIMSMDWQALKACVASCSECALHQRRTRTVFGVGDENASWMFVGEGPGAEEDAKGEPFVGQAGRLLDNMLAAIGLKRGADAYIANVVKCRPPGNRNPEPGEALACEPFLHRQIELIRPKLIVALGKVAAANLLATDASVASMRGKVHEYRGTPLIVTYHPAYLLRNLPDKAKAWEDLCFAVKVMQGLQGAGSAPR